MRSNSFDTQEVREIDRKKSGESRDFPILWMAIVQDVFRWKERNAKSRKN